MASATGPALAFERVSKRFGKAVLALDNVTWAVERGARACLLGPNGAGKSTAIRLLQGALTPTAGRVTLLDADVNGSGYLAARRQTGIVPQGPGMYQDLTTGEYLDLAARLSGGVNSARVIDVFGLKDHLGKMLAQLSGGYQRRVSLAAALMGEPALLLLDEPTVGLDPVAASEVHAYLREAMHMPGRTTLLCTHNLAEAEALCDEVVILRRGQVLVHESLEALRRREAPQVRLMARQGSEALRAALRQRGLAATLERGAADAGDAVLVALADAPRQAPDLLRGLLNDGLDVYECAQVQASLEELFLDLVRDDKDSPVETQVSAGPAGAAEPVGARVASR